MLNFLNQLFSNFWFETFFRLILGFFLAGILGLERSNWNKPAGFRTYSLVGISAVLVMMCGEYLSNTYNLSDPTRIPAQLLSGIGFIGAGTILKDGINIKGLTTASGLLAVTCIGMCIGAGFYLGGILATIIVYILLSYSYIFSSKLEHFSDLCLNVSIDTANKETLVMIKNIFEENQIEVKQFSQEKKSNVSVCQLLLRYNNRNYTPSSIILLLLELEHITNVEEDSNSI